MLPLKDARTYRFRYRFGNETKVGFIVAEKIGDARNLLRRKKLKVIGKLRYFKKIKVIADKHVKIEPHKVSKSYIDDF